jgi:hypothetical protein
VLVEQLVRAGHVVVRGAGPGVRLLLDPPLVPPSRRPVRLVEALARRGRAERAAAFRRLDRLVAARVPALVDHVAVLVPLTELVRQHIDIDALVASVDLDAAVARVDLDAAVARVDLDAAVAGVDIDAIVRTVDLDAAVAGVDLDAIAARLDIEAVLDRIDLTDLVMKRVDLDAIVRSVDLDAAVAGVDLDAILARVDLEALANDVIAAIDLPEIIRESSGSLTSETVRNVRMHSIDADRAVDKVIERLRVRRPPRPGDVHPGGAPS